MKENNTNQSEKIAGRHYQIEDYQNNDEVSSGLATTHEQISDNYFGGTIDRVTNPDNENGEENTAIPRRYEE